MRNMEKELIFFFIITYLCSTYAQNLEAQSVKLEALRPRGLRVTVQDNGYLSCRFVGFINREGETEKEWRIYEPRAKNGLWVLTDRNYELRFGDTIRYSIIVVTNSSQFRINGNWTVSVPHICERILWTTPYRIMVNRFFIDNEALTCDEISETNTLCSKEFCKGTLIFSEEFDDLLNSKWKIEHMFPQGPDYPFNAYSNDNVNVESGELVITPRTLSGLSQTWDMGYACTGEPGTNECKQSSMGPQILPPVVSGKVTTRNLFSFKYGRIDVRAKLPEGDWLIPEINLEPLYNEYGRQHYGSGLIRIAYVRGNQKFDHELYGGPVTCDKEPCRSSFLKKSPKISSSWNEHFHVFSLIWKPDGFELLVDDELYGEVKPHDGVIIDGNSFKISATPHAEVWKRGTAITPFDQLFYISLGVRVGGINDFADSRGKPWLNSSPKAMVKFWEDSYYWNKTWISPQLIVDYVRVYSL